MKCALFRYSKSFQALEIFVGVVFLFVCSAHAQKHETFSERPSKRMARADEMRRQDFQNRANARAWAKRRNIPQRHDDGARVSEIVAIRGGRPLILTTMNEDAAISSNADLVRDDLGIRGNGVDVGIWDGGHVKTNHQEFGVRIVTGDFANPHYHATHVGGTIAAAGVSAKAMGMAPDARLFSYDWNSNHAEIIQKAAAAPSEGNRLYISNHSYGITTGWSYYSWLNPYTRRSGYHWWGDIFSDEADAYFGQYGYWVRYWDEIIYDAPYHLLFKAAGNERNDNPSDGSRVYYTLDGEEWTNTVYDSSIHTLGDGIVKNGYDTVPYYGNAKNIMTVGAVDDAVANGERDITNAALAEFSSWGPADDGRIKPDIVANGVNVYSANSPSTTAYASRSGTSMACPNASGSAALLVDYYDDLFSGQAMRASTLKGLIIHTADDLGRPGPDYQFGWGLLNTRRAADKITELYGGNLISISEELLASGQTNRFSVYADGAGPIKVTLCWTDPPGPFTDDPDSRLPVLVNDLDLSVSGGGEIFYPYRLQYADPEALPKTNGKNQVDNVEQVVFEVPAPGMYTIEISHAGVLQDEEQHYSLITSGVVSDSDQDGLPDYWENEFFQNLTGSITFLDFDGDGLDNLQEYIAGTDPTDPSSIFTITSVEAVPATNESPVVIEWDALPGRVYSVSWTYHLQYVPFEMIADEIRWPVSSYTDAVERIGNASLYRIDVRMDD